MDQAAVAQGVLKEEGSLQFMRLEVVVEGVQNQEIITEENIEYILIQIMKYSVTVLQLSVDICKGLASAHVV